MMVRSRLDAEMVRRELADTRSAASRLIGEHLVLVNGSVALKSARMVERADTILVTNPATFVSRGGEKLSSALDAFALDPAGNTVLDVGSSTGGFTDCLLQRGAEAVVSIDVGRGQLHDRLRRDDRVTSLERTDIRSVVPADIGAEFRMVVMDLSFISICSVIGSVVSLMSPGGDLIALVKPQFEVGRAVVSRTKGVVKNPRHWSAALERVLGCCSEAGLQALALKPSPIRGGAGNVEFLAHLRRGAGSGTIDQPALISCAIEAVESS